MLQLLFFTGGDAYLKAMGETFYKDPLVLTASTEITVNGGEV